MEIVNMPSLSVLYDQTVVHSLTELKSFCLQLLRITPYGLSGLKVPIVYR